MPSELEELVLDMLEKNREHRPALDELRDALREQRAAIAQCDRDAAELEVEYEMEIEIDLEREDEQDAAIAREFEAAASLDTQPAVAPTRARGVRWTPPLSDNAASNLVAAIERALDRV
jgi:hypothetical protein